MKHFTRRKFLRRSLYFGISGVSIAAIYQQPPAVAKSAAETQAPLLAVAQGLSDTTTHVIWMAVAGAQHYSLYRNGALIASQAGTFFDDGGLAPLTTYTYEVSATVDGVESARTAARVTTQAAIDTTPPTQPGPITVSNITESTAFLQWSRSNSPGGVIGYRILRGPAGAPATDLTQLETTDAITNYAPTNLLANTAYQFAVVAVNAAGSLSAPSLLTFTTASAVTTTEPVPVSSNSVSGVAFSSSRIDLLWGAPIPASNDLVGYQIVRNGQPIGDVRLPLRRSFSDNGLQPSTQYSYQIRTINSAGNVSALTTPRTITTSAVGFVKIMRGPYLQWATSTTIRIAWWTNIPAPSEVQYGVGELTAKVSDPVLKYHHMMLIGGLEPGTVYRYQVASGNASVEPATFTTAALPGTTWTFAAVADFGGGSTQETAIANQIARKGTQFVQTMGDNIYPDAQDPDFATTYSDFDSRLYKPYRDVMRQQPIWFANGNKEYYGDGAFWRHVLMPNNKRWYSYNWGDAHFLILDFEYPYQPGTPQYQFIQADLAAHQDMVWRIAIIHLPPYSSTTLNSSAEKVRDNLRSLFQQQRVQLVLSGNSHNYERSFPLINDDRQDANGTTYIVSGGGGNGLNQFVIDAPPWSAFRAAVYQYLHITVSPSTLQIDATKADDGTIFDSTSIAPGEQSKRYVVSLPVVSKHGP